MAKVKIRGFVSRTAAIAAQRRKEARDARAQRDRHWEAICAAADRRFRAGEIAGARIAMHWENWSLEALYAFFNRRREEERLARLRDGKDQGV